MRYIFVTGAFHILCQSAALEPFDLHAPSNVLIRRENRSLYRLLGVQAPFYRQKTFLWLCYQQRFVDSSDTTLQRFGQSSTRTRRDFRKSFKCYNQKCEDILESVSHICTSAPISPTSREVKQRVRSMWDEDEKPYQLVLWRNKKGNMGIGPIASQQEMCRNEPKILQSSNPNSLQ